MVANLIPAKRCPKCGETKPIDQWARWKNGKDGLWQWCRTCSSAHQRAKYLKRQLNGKNEEQKRERLREYRRLRDIEYRTCTKCEKRKKLRHFTFSPATATRLCKGACTSCYLAYHREYYNANREREIAQEKERRRLKYVNRGRCDCSAVAGGTLVVPPLAPIPVPAKLCARCFHLDGTNITERRVISALEILGGSASTSALEMEVAGSTITRASGNRTMYRALSTLILRRRVVNLVDEDGEESVFALAASGPIWRGEE